MVLPLLPLWGSLVACQRTPTANAQAPAPLERDVRVAVAVDESWPTLLRIAGDLHADEDALLASKVAGRVASVAVDLGTRVEAGAPLLQLDPRDFELRCAQAVAALEAACARVGLPPGGVDSEWSPAAVPLVRQAQIELDEAERELARLASLSGDGIASLSALDVARSRVDSAQSALGEALHEVASRRALVVQRTAELDLARQQLADTTLRAPFAGTIAARLVDRGEAVAVGSAVARLVRLDPIRLRLAVPASAAGRLRIGLPVQFEGPPERPPIAATLCRVAPDLDPRSRTMTVEADVENRDGGLRPGDFVDAVIVLDAEARALVVPLAALVRFAGVDRVVLARAGKAVEQLVTVGRIDGERAELLAGIAAGEAVILAPGTLHTGDPLRVVE